MTQREENFPALLERLRPECERIIAQYEQKRSALLPIMHLFQEHEGYVSAQAMNAAALMFTLRMLRSKRRFRFIRCFIGGRLESTCCRFVAGWRVRLMGPRM